MVAHRNLGIDFLRILSMYMVVILHVLGAGGVLSNSDWMSSQYLTAWAVEIAAYCAVNCFGLISGYVGYTAKFRWSKLATLWLQVLFYSLLITIIFALLIPESVSLSNWLKSILPVTEGTYWYITAYVGMFLLTPFLNIAIERTEQKHILSFVVAALVIVIILPTMTRRDPYILNDGYSTLGYAYFIC